MSPSQPRVGDDSGASPRTGEFALLDAMRDVIVIADRGGTIVYTNPVVERVLGWLPEELVGQPLTRLIPERLRDAHLSAFANVMAGGTPRIIGGDPVTVPGLHRDGGEVEVELTLSSHQGAPEQGWTIANLRETSARKRLERAESRSRYLALSVEVARRIALTEDVRTVTEAGEILLQTVGEMLGWEVAVLWIVDEHGASRPFRSWASTDLAHALPELAGPEWRFELGSGLPGRVVASRHPAWIEDVALDEDFPRQKVAAAHGIATAFAFPIHAGGRVDAVVEMLQREQRPVDAVLLGIAEQIGSGVGQFLERRRTTEELEATKARKAAMLDSSFDAVVTIDHVGQVVQWNPAAVAIFGWTEEEALGKPMADLIIPEGMRQQHLDAVERHLRTGVDTIIGRPVELPALCKDGREITVEVGITRLQEADPPEYIGFIRDVTDRKEAERQLAESRDRLHGIVEVLQESLLPAELPTVEGLEVGASYRPAGDGTLIGGDFYDLLRIGESRWAAFIGDVAGKGPEAATVTALVRYTLRTAAVQGLDAQRGVELCNDALMADDRERFCTVVHLTVDVGPSSTVRLVRAGHPPPLLLRADGSISPIQSTGVVLGVLPSASLEPVHLVLHPGDALLLYTDGVTEARVEGGLLGQSGLVELLGEARGRDAQDTVTHLCERVVELQAGRPRDDVALLMLRQPR